MLVQLVLVGQVFIARSCPAAVTVFFCWGEWGGNFMSQLQKSLLPPTLQNGPGLSRNTSRKIKPGPKAHIHLCVFDLRVQVHGFKPVVPQ